MSEQVHYRCPAKVNLALSVGRPDKHGYHPLCSWMVSVNLYDELTLTKAEENSYDIHWLEDAPHPTRIDWPLEKDLTYKAHRYLEETVERELPVKMELGKRIPVGAGLAGGSTDGIHFLLAMNELYDLKMDKHAINKIAAKLGSDLSFFLEAPSAIVTGRGTEAHSVAYPCPLFILMFLPNFGCPTAEVYHTFDTVQPRAKVNDAKVFKLLENEPLPHDAPFNDLEKAACRVQPALEPMRRKLRFETGVPVHITGSGAGMYCIAHSLEEAQAMYKRLKPREELHYLILEKESTPSCMLPD